MSVESFIFACEAGILDNVVLFYSCNENKWGLGLYSACLYCRTNVVNYLVDICTSSSDFNEGLMGACEGDHCEFIPLMIENGANDFDGALDVSCRCGHYEIAQFMIENGAIVTEDHFVYACDLGHFELAELLIENGDGPFDYNYGLKLARRDNNVKMIELMLKHGATHPNEDNDNNK